MCVGAWVREIERKKRRGRHSQFQEKDFTPLLPLSTLLYPSIFLPHSLFPLSFFPSPSLSVSFFISFSHCFFFPLLYFLVLSKFFSLSHAFSLPLLFFLTLSQLSPSLDLSIPLSFLLILSISLSLSPSLILTPSLFLEFPPSLSSIHFLPSSTYHPLPLLSSW